MSDIVERLRRCKGGHIDGIPVCPSIPINPDGPKAADEITRLREANKELVEAHKFIADLAISNGRHHMVRDSFDAAQKTSSAIIAKHKGELK